MTEETSTQPEPRPWTAEEVRDSFLESCREIAEYWSNPGLSRGSTWPERIHGTIHSLLCLIDGVTLDLPAFILTADPHPDDKNYYQERGENWTEPGTIINGTVALHELLRNPSSSPDPVTLPQSETEPGADPDTDPGTDPDTAGENPCDK